MENVNERRRILATERKARQRDQERNNQQNDNRNLDLMD